MKADRDQSGMALVTTLAAILLVTIAVVATLSNSNNFAKWSLSSENRSNAVALTRGVAHVVASEYQKQILAAAVLESSLPQKVEGLTILSPQNSSQISSAIPYRTVLPSLENNLDFANLIGQSLPSKPLFPNGATPYNQTEVELALPVGASDVSSSTPAKNDRFVSGKRWSTPRLLSQGSEFSNDQTPYWIYLNREGSALSQDFSQELTQRQSANPEFALGRFAFNVYDVGAILDANVAGYDSSSATDAKLKGGQSWADLTAIPGFNSSKISNFIRWRNPKGLSNYLSTIENWLGPRGFLLPYRTGSQGDRFFGSRQDMIRFHLTHPEALPEEALPYLTHWTRSLDQPSYIPSTERPKIVQKLADGGNDAFGKEEEINPNINQFYDSKGNPLMKTRFPLSRLDLVANNIQIPNGPTEDKVDKIDKYFGLKWDQANNQWIYKHGEGNSGVRILMLSEIPQENGKWSREPDFFEVLKTAINAGSLGKQSGILDDYNNTTISEQGFSLTSKYRLGKTDGWNDLQIMRIGACIIDQYGSEGYPTRISFNSQNIYGLKNHPYIYMSYLSAYRGLKWSNNRAAPNASKKIMEPINKSGSTSSYLLHCLLQPTLWNPHAPSTVTVKGPTSFRVVLETDGAPIETYAETFNDDGTIKATRAQDLSIPSMLGPNLTGKTITYSSNPSSANYAYLQFNTTITGAASFREPRTLSTPGFPSGSSSTGFPDKTDYNPDTNNQADIQNIDTIATIPSGNFTELGNAPNPISSTTTTALGFKMGIGHLNTSTGSSSSFFKDTTAFRCNNPIRMILQYLGTDGKWYAFDEMSDSLLYNQGCRMYSIVDNKYFDIPCINSRWDPRTNRWGTTHLNIDSFGSYNDTLQNSRSLAPCSMNPIFTNGSGSSATTLDYELALTYKQLGNKPDRKALLARGWNLINMASGANAQNLKTKFLNIQTNIQNSITPYYTDPDQVLRNADGAYRIKEEGLSMTTVSQDALAMGRFPPKATNGTYDSRPVILNRAFRSVAEMGYAFRDTAWKSIDFCSPQSPDAALLDYFTLYEPDTTDQETNSESATPPPLVGGMLNPNGSHAEVYQAMIQGTAKNASLQISNEEAKNISEALVKWTQSREKEKGPFQNRSELVGKYIGSKQSTNSTDYTGFLSTVAPLLSGTDSAIKSKRESLLRGLVDTCNTRTWNLMIDVIGQTGRLSKSATNLKEFEVAGESRYWFFVSIDRYTGKIIDSSFELVTE